jgi:hypothetical protein
MLIPADRRWHMDDPLNKLGLLQRGHRCIATLELDARELIAWLQRRRSDSWIGCRA